jgi:dipeptidyl aminopeptidase/acylaminoacyl peptidase
VNFVGGDKRRVNVSFLDATSGSVLSTEYRLTIKGEWQATAKAANTGVKVAPDGLRVGIRQALNQPPALVASRNHGPHVIWDPNPQLEGVKLAAIEIFTWKDKDGRDWKGGLFKPTGPKTGQRYPLVIQTHGFEESEFIPSGLLPPFAAQELAGAGIAVLQVRDVGHGCPMGHPSEVPCVVAGYEAAVAQLQSDGVVDAANVGIIGFSYTGVYVMGAATSGSLHLKAASIVDCTLEDYFQYMSGIDFFGSKLPAALDTMVGARPFGLGLQQWLKNSSGFNLDKVDAPLLVIAEGRASLLGMWQSYAGLRYLHKPVDLMMLNMENGAGSPGYEHVPTNPAFRVQSQGSNVDWFRFWLQGYEDPDPAKADQYRRWRALRHANPSGN